jgi:hypothetical protein
MSENKESTKTNGVLIIVLIFMAIFIVLNIGSIHRLTVEKAIAETELRLLKERCQ